MSTGRLNDALGHCENGGYWQPEGNAAELYQRYLVPAITSKWAEDLVARAQLRAGDTVLDLACGTGVVARLAARWVAPGRVTGLDLNASMLAVARSVSDGAAINWMEGSALDLPFGSESFDAVLCQLGLQFFPDRPKALREMRRVLRLEGHIALSVFSPIERTPGAHAFARAIEKVFGTHASSVKRGEHCFFDPAELEALLQDAAFASIDVQTVTQTLTFPSVLNYVRFQLVATPQTGLLRDRQDAEHEAIIASVASETARLSTPTMLRGGTFTFPQEAYVVLARAR